MRGIVSASVQKDVAHVVDANAFHAGNASVVATSVGNALQANHESTVARFVEVQITHDTGVTS